MYSRTWLKDNEEAKNWTLHSPVYKVCKEFVYRILTCLMNKYRFYCVLFPFLTVFCNDYACF